MDPWIIAATFAKFGLYLGALTSAGLSLNAAIFARWVNLPSLRQSTVWFALLGMLCALASFTLQGAMLTGDASGLIDREILTLLWDTNSGTALAWRVIGFLGLIICIYIGAKARWTAALFGCAILYSFVQIGHIADKQQALITLILWLHLVFAAFWIGVLFPLKHLLGTQDTVNQAMYLGQAFGRIAIYTVPALIFTGLIMIYSLVEGLNGFFTAYGMTLLAKLVIVGVLLLLGATNKLKLVPALKTNPSTARLSLITVIKMEWAAFLCIFAATAFMTV
ncbi:MAG: copper resistance D family protein [Planktomarina sp.]